MEYILRVDQNIRSLYNEAVTTFIGFLRANGIRTVTSETVRKETGGQLVYAVNSMLDKVWPRRKWQVRSIVLTRCGKRLQKLWSRVDVLPLQGNEKLVDSFYKGMLKNPATKARLEKVRRLKGRKRLLPEDTDIKILSEAIALKKPGEILFFITKDEDFCEFSYEIENHFGLKVLSVQDLFKFKNELERAGRSLRLNNGR